MEKYIYKGGFNKMYKKFTIIIILIVSMGLFLTGCGSSGGDTLTSVEKEEIRVEIRSLIYDFSENEDTAEKEIEKMQNRISSNAEITVIDEYGDVYPLTKEEYIDMVASVYSMGYEVVSSQIDNLIITVNSSSRVNSNFKVTSVWSDGQDTIEGSALIKVILEKQGGKWIIVELRESSV